LRLSLRLRINRSGLRVLRDEILAFFAILAAAVSRLRIGPHQNNDKLSAEFQVHAELAFRSG
jgi:hypothetical protein